MQIGDKIRLFFALLFILRYIVFGRVRIGYDSRQAVIDAMWVAANVGFVARKWRAHDYKSALIMVASILILANEYWFIMFSLARMLSLRNAVEPVTAL